MRYGLGVHLQRGARLEAFFEDGVRSIELLTPEGLPKIARSEMTPLQIDMVIELLRLLREGTPPGVPESEWCHAIQAHP